MCCVYCMYVCTDWTMLFVCIIKNLPNGSIAPDVLVLTFFDDQITIILLDGEIVLRFPSY
jgi:hypothetical protein